VKERKESSFQRKSTSCKFLPISLPIVY
jgi:hypothetical protein